MKSNATVRLFLALWPDATVRDALAAHQQAWHWPARAAVVAAERLHLTLHFIGAVDAARVEGLRHGLAVPFTRFTLTLEGARPLLWPGSLAVLELDAPDPLRTLHARLAQRLQASGLPVEARAFRPHITLARKAAGARTAPAAPQVAWPVGGYALVRSTPTLGYQTLQTYAPR